MRNTIPFRESQDYDPDQEFKSEACPHKWRESIGVRKKITVCILCGEVKKMNIKKLYGVIASVLFAVLGLISYIKGGGESYTLIFFALGLLFFYTYHLQRTFQEVIDKEKERTTLNEQDILKLIKEIGEIQQVQEGTPEEYITTNGIEHTVPEEIIKEEPKAE